MVVCFDLGGVLVRICRTWEEGCAAAGIEPRSFEPAHDHAERRQVLIDALQRGELNDHEFHRRVSELFDGTWSPDEVRRVDAAWLLGTYPGTAELVRDLHRREHRTACLSNTSAGHWTPLLDFEPVGLLAERHASHLLGLVKPEQGIYAEFERRLGVEPAEIVFFDDLLPNVEAARLRGWDAIRIDHEGDTAAQMRGVLEARGIL